MYENYVYETIPDYIESKQLSDNLKDQIPLCTDGLPVWNAYLKFFENYVDFFYANENSIRKDIQLRLVFSNLLNP